MRIETYRCDRCGEPAFTSVRMSLHELVPRENAEPLRCEPHDFYELDLCDRCMQALLEVVDERSHAND